MHIAQKWKPTALVVTVTRKFGCSRKTKDHQRRSATLATIAGVSGPNGGKTNGPPAHDKTQQLMQRFTEGDRVRIDIPDETDVDHDRYHRVHGTVVNTIEDDAGGFTEDDRDSTIFRVELDTGESADFRWRDLRPPDDGDELNE